MSAAQQELGWMAKMSAALHLQSSLPLLSYLITPAENVALWHVTCRLHVVGAARLAPRLDGRDGVDHQVCCTQPAGGRRDRGLLLWRRQRQVQLGSRRAVRRRGMKNKDSKKQQEWP